MRRRPDPAAAQRLKDKLADMPSERLFAMTVDVIMAFRPGVERREAETLLVAAQANRRRSEGGLA